MLLQNLGEKGELRMSAIVDSVSSLIAIAALFVISIFTIILVFYVLVRVASYAFLRSYLDFLNKHRSKS